MLEFLLTLIERSADRAARHGPVLVAHTPSLPACWTLNQVRATDPVTFDELVALAERHQAQLPYRHVVVEGDRAATALEPNFVSAGWELERDVLMVLDGPPAQWQPAAQVTEIGEEPMLALMRRWQSEQHPGLPADELDQLVEMAKREGVAMGEQRFGVLDIDAMAVAVTKLRSHRGTAQVEDVYTRPDHRRRGLARTLVTQAATLAHASHDCTFIMADDDDWPKELYARIGFRPFERFSAFHLRR